MYELDLGRHIHELSIGTKRLFDKYNGLINVTVPARLQVECCRTSNTHRVGTSFYPDLVVVYPMNIIINCAEILPYQFELNDVLSVIAETVIHELFHIDQIVLHGKYNMDREYLKNIEDAVEFMTMTYMANNKDSITRNVVECFADVIPPNYNISIEYASKPNKEISLDHWYNRSTIHDHIVCGIGNILCNHPDCKMYLNNVIEAFESGDAFTIIINGNELPITWFANGELYIVDIFYYNNFMTDNWFKYDCVRFSSTSVQMSYNKEKRTLILSINTINQYNNMFAIVKEME